MSIEELVPRTSTSIDNLGFLFGAGTSYESGYPLVAGLTQQVVSALNAEDLGVLTEVLAAFGKSYDTDSSRPNIEEISDMVIEHHTNSQSERFGNLKEKIRELVRDAILGVEKPDISNQIRFFEGLKSRAYDRPTQIWVFTTNYDVLFEDACAEVGLKVINGFIGATTRCFSDREFSIVSGTKSGTRFSQESGLTVRLIKLHGSVSWFHKENRVFETSPTAIREGDLRTMVLPRRTKVLETLHHPYDALFRISSHVLGDQCKYLISSGFSFGDSHINDTLVIPRTDSGDISLFNFCQQPPHTLGAITNRPNVWHYCEDKTINKGRETEAQHNTWMFSEFAKLF